ncbi:hypothetical protein [Micromonospora sp. NPDC023633]|uniref:hypothetical protein n=1 Tax=Micromonospora sp. NPDC023633 TaxID=3154320 RepID=UPI0033DC3F6E
MTRISRSWAWRSLVPAKARGLDPAVRPDWNVVAGLRDLTNALVEQAGQAQADAGED